MQPATETRLRVRYAETDQMGVVYYANYLVWMEVGRVELCKALGFNYGEMERDDGVLLAVAEACCRYLSPARFDDEVIVKTWVEEANSRMATFAYEMRLAGLEFAREVEQEIFYKDLAEPIGTRRADFVVERKVLVELKANEQWAQVPVLLISTESSQTKVMEALRLGAKGFIRKPFEPDQIQDKLASFL